MIAAALALLAKNSPMAASYDAFLAFPTLGGSLLSLVNDGLMALFFLHIGLELKREIYEGALKEWQQVVFPAVGALGGMVVPALIYVTFTHHSPELLRGWAIPSATDIAFSLGVLSLLSGRVPLSLKLFLTTLAVFDDIGAILIIAVFYASHFSPLMLFASLVVVGVLYALNRAGVKYLTPYLLLGGLLWVTVHHSGIHATLSGVVLAFFIPLEVGKAYSPLVWLEHRLRPWVAYGIVPLFGFMNAGLSLASHGLSGLLHPVSLGVMLGLFIGKQIGIMLFCRVLVGLKWAILPKECNWLQLYGICLLAGIGFTMSLFIGLLAFPAGEMIEYVKLGVLAGSLLSALAGYLVLRFLPPRAIAVIKCN